VLRATGGLAQETTWFASELTRRVSYKLTHGVSWRQVEPLQQDDDDDDDDDYTVEDFDQIVAGQEPLLLFQQQQQQDLPGPLHTTKTPIGTEMDQVLATAAATSTRMDEEVTTPGSVPNAMTIEEAVVEKLSDVASKGLETTSNQDDVDQEDWLGSIGLGPTTAVDEDVGNDANFIQSIKENAAQSSMNTDVKNIDPVAFMPEGMSQTAPLPNVPTDREPATADAQQIDQESWLGSIGLGPSLTTAEDAAASVTALPRSIPVVETAEPSETKSIKSETSPDAITSKALEEFKQQKEESTRRSLLEYRLMLHANKRAQNERQQSIQEGWPSGRKSIKSATSPDAIASQALEESKQQKEELTRRSLLEYRFALQANERQRSSQEDWLGSIGLGTAATMDGTQSTEIGTSGKSVEVKDSSKGEGEKTITSMTWLEDAPQTQSSSIVAGPVSLAGGDKVEQVEGETTSVTGGDSLQPNEVASEEVSFSVVGNQNVTVRKSIGERSSQKSSSHSPLAHSNSFVQYTSGGCG
jgi:hypothetical protein